MGYASKSPDFNILIIWFVMQNLEHSVAQLPVNVVEIKIAVLYYISEIELISEHMAVSDCLLMNTPTPRLCQPCFKWWTLLVAY